MIMPSFGAEAVLSPVTRGLRCPPPGTCNKAAQLCRRGDEMPWCGILTRCFGCEGLDDLPPRQPVCRPVTTCTQDPATTDPRCQVCVRNNCDGTQSLWHTC